MKEDTKEYVGGERDWRGLSSKLLVEVYMQNIWFGLTFLNHKEKFECL
jgi:hypothetical protein